MAARRYEISLRVLKRVSAEQCVLYTDFTRNLPLFQSTLRQGCENQMGK